MKLRTQYTITFNVVWEGIKAKYGGQGGVTILERKKNHGADLNLRLPSFLSVQNIENIQRSFKYFPNLGSYIYGEGRG